MSREGKLAKNTLILAFGTFFPKMAIFITLPVLTAMLTKEEYGTYDLVITLVALILPAATLQIQTAAFRFLIDVHEDEKEKSLIITNIYAFVLPITFVILIILFVFLRGVSVVEKLSICAYFLFDILVNVNRQIIRGLSRNVDYAISALISSIGHIILVLILVMGMKQGLSGGLASLAFAEGFSSIYLFIIGRIPKFLGKQYISRTKLKELLSYSWPMVPNGLSQWVIHASDRLVITFFLGITANAVYSVAYKIPQILSLAQTTFNMAWQENASLTVNDEDVISYYSSMFQLLFNIVSGMMSILIGLTPMLFLIFIKGDYAEAYNQIPILFMGMFFLCLSTFWGGLFVAQKQTKEVGLTTVIAAVINLSIDLIFVRKIGIYAGSISSLTAYFSLCLLRAREIQKKIKIDYHYKTIGIILGILVFQCIICLQKSTILNYINICIGIMIGILLNRKLIGIVFHKSKMMV